MESGAATEVVGVGKTTMMPTMGAMAMAPGGVNNIHGHPALLKWSPPRNHRFSPAQLEALAAICDAFVPSLPPPSFENVDLLRGVTQADVTRFYKLKPSDEDVIDVVRFLSTACSHACFPCAPIVQAWHRYSRIVQCKLVVDCLARKSLHH